MKVSDRTNKIPITPSFLTILNALSVTAKVIFGMERKTGLLVRPSLSKKSTGACFLTQEIHLWLLSHTRNPPVVAFLPIKFTCSCSHPKNPLVIALSPENLLVVALLSKKNPPR